jgi:hypothetical protein
MAVMYPATALAGTSATWAKELGAYPAPVVEAAAGALLKRTDAWPPTLPQFLALCDEAMLEVTPRKPPPRQVSRARTPAELEYGQEQLQHVRALLGGALRRPRVTPRAARMAEQGVEEPLPIPEPVCTCWNGMTRAETLCPGCAAFVGDRIVARRVADETKAAAR